MRSPSLTPESDPLPWTSAPQPIPIRILTHNIRYATTSPFKGELPWPSRQHVFLSELHHHTNNAPFTPPLTLICLQEVLHSQLQDIHSSLNSQSDSQRQVPSSSIQWSTIGRARDDGIHAGEYSPILYPQHHLTLLHHDTIWLNETGRIGRKGWDAASVRIVTVAVFTPTDPLYGARRILVLNTHLDDQGAISRRESAKKIVELARELRRKWSVDWWVLVGDLNSEIDGDAYRLLNATGSGFVDARVCLDDYHHDDDDDDEGDGKEGGTDDDVTANANAITTRSTKKRDLRKYGEENTFTGFDSSGDGEGLKRIDFIHLGTSAETLTERIMEGRKLLKGYAVLANRFADDGVYMSDHRGVLVDVLV